MINLQELTPAMVKRGYVGKPGCACGCKGKYYESGSLMVTKILRTIQANENLVTDEGGWLEARVGGKDYVVYLD